MWQSVDREDVPLGAHDPGAGSVATLDQDPVDHAEAATVGPESGHDHLARLGALPAQGLPAFPIVELVADGDEAGGLLGIHRRRGNGLHRVADESPVADGDAQTRQDGGENVGHERIAVQELTHTISSLFGRLSPVVCKTAVANAIFW